MNVPAPIKMVCHRTEYLRTSHQASREGTAKPNRAATAMEMRVLTGIMLKDTKNLE